MSGVDVNAIKAMLKKVREEQNKKTLKINNKDERKRNLSKIKTVIKKTNNT
jgi:hypothetical protein